MEAQQLLLQNGEEKKFEIFVDPKKATVIKLNFSNERLAKCLQDAGVPLIAQSAEEAQTVYLAKKAKWALQSGGGSNTVRAIPMQTTGSIIDGTGRKVNLPLKSSVNGLEIFDLVAQLSTEVGGIVYLRLQNRPTENSLAQGKTKPSFSLKAYFVPEFLVDEKMKKGTGSKKFSMPEAREILKELINVTWFINIFRNPNPATIVFDLAQRQPDNKNPTLKPSLFLFSN